MSVIDRTALIVNRTPAAANNITDTLISVICYRIPDISQKTSQATRTELTTVMNLGLKSKSDSSHGNQRQISYNFRKSYKINNDNEHRDTASDWALSTATEAFLRHALDKTQSVILSTVQQTHPQIFKRIFECNIITISLPANIITHDIANRITNNDVFITNRDIYLIIHTTFKPKLEPRYIISTNHSRRFSRLQ